MELRYTEWASSAPTAYNPKIGVASHTQARRGLNPCGGWWWRWDGGDNVNSGGGLRKEEGWGRIIGK